MYSHDTMDETDPFKVLEKVIVLLKEEGVLSDVNNKCKVIEFKHPNDLKVRIYLIIWYGCFFFVIIVISEYN